MKSTTNQRREHVGYNSVAIFIRLAVVASQISEIPRNSTKIRNYSSSRSSKVNDLGVNRKRIIVQLPISHDVSLTVFEILMHLARK